MTEDEAKGKWCPFAGPTRFSHQSEECIASACMAWRATDNQPVNPARSPTDASPVQYVAAGYCGLAGGAL